MTVPGTIGAAARVDELVSLACQRAGSTDFGSDTWREGLTLLVSVMEALPDAVSQGRDDLYRQFVDALANRLRLYDYRARHPEVANERIERPLIILGLPRTGTTVASYLLDCDPARRSLLNWEAGDSAPPATSATLRTDPRCLAKKAELDDFAKALEEARFPIPHWEDADGPTECTFVQNQDFKAFLWEAYMPSAHYADWLLATDMASAYQYEHDLLQVLQSQAPGTWSLKMPSHVVHIDALLDAFPDARLVWAHRDPYRVTASYLSMNELSRAFLSTTPPAEFMVPIVLRQLEEHVTRGLRARRRSGDDRFFDLHYADLMRDPIGQMRALYAWADEPLTENVEAQMQRWLDANPQDRFGTRPYSLDVYGITTDDLRPIFADYLSTFDIELET